MGPRSSEESEPQSRRCETGKAKFDQEKHAASSFAGDEAKAHLHGWVWCANGRNQCSPGSVQSQTSEVRQDSGSWSTALISMALPNQ